MKFGLLPSYRGASVADPEYVRAVAGIAEGGGCDSIWTVEHMIVPADYTSRYPYAPGGRMPLTGDDPIPDPLEWLAFVAAVTQRIRLGTCIIILPEHHPVQLAKRLATIDALSGGRMMVGVGVGWLEEESRALGVPFSERGARTDEYIDVMRALWQSPVASFQGRFVQFDAVKSAPRPIQPGGVPIVIGGHSPAAARRAGRRGDGFYPLGVGPDELSSLLAIMRSAAVDAGRSADRIEITTGAPTDLAEAKRLAELGVHRFIISARGSSGDIDGVRRLVGEFAESIVSPLG
jgi:probable F420-dependent oxidoreductase